MSTNSSIFAGGSGDGFDLHQISIKTNADIFSGGDGDGVDDEMISIQSNDEIFVGGFGDGYDHSKISKLIWTGALSSDWLMAANWNINRTPTLSDYVAIPGGLEKYPNLKVIY